MNQINIESKKKICFVVTTFSIANAFLKEHIDKLSSHFSVFLIGNFTDEEIILINNYKISGVKTLPIKRKIHFYNDLCVLIRLAYYFKKQDFFAVHSVSPKAGLLTALAGYIISVPNRIHIFTGQVWHTKHGFMKILLKFIDWIIAHLNTKILIDSHSQKEFLIKNNVVKKSNSLVIGNGSITGVNIERFNPNPEIKHKIRKILNISDQAIVFVYLGRLNREKGIQELLKAFDKLAKNEKNAFLLLIGIDEEKITNSISEYKNINIGCNYLYYGKTNEPEILLQAGDVFCFPSHREGFGLSVIEASCLGLPVICSDTYGLKDAFIPNQTGLQCKVGDIDLLASQMKMLFDNKILRVLLGQNGRLRVINEFSTDLITNAWLEMYLNLLANKV